jgi:hypothetical protein
VWEPKRKVERRRPLERVWEPKRKGYLEQVLLNKQVKKMVKILKEEAEMQMKILREETRKIYLACHLGNQKRT